MGMVPVPPKRSRLDLEGERSKKGFKEKFTDLGSSSKAKPYNPMFAKRITLTMWFASLKFLVR
jgi:hypothetical protein